MQFGSKYGQNAIGTQFSGPLRNKNTLKGYVGGFRAWRSYMPIDNDPDFVKFLNDYLKATDYSTSDTTLTLVGTGSAAVETTTNSLGGALLLTTGAAGGPDSDNLQWKENCFQLRLGKRLWFDASAQVSDVATADFFIGLSIQNTTLGTPTEAIGFRMTTGAALIVGQSALASTVTTVNAPANSTGINMVANTYTRFSMYYDGLGNVFYFVNGQLIGNSSTNIPAATLAQGIYLASNSAQADTALIDYVNVVAER